MSLLTDLVAYWKMDEASGTRIDSHGSIDLTDNNTVGSATGKINNAADFEKDNTESLTSSAAGALFSGVTAFTINLWVNAESLVDFQGILGSQNSNTWSLIYRDGTRLRWNVAGTDQDYSYSLSTSAWVMITVGFDDAGNQTFVSVNGAAKTTSSNTGTPSTTATLFAIGFNTGTGTLYWDGLVDEVGFWSRVLTDDEISQLYNSGNGLAYEDFGGSGNISGSAAWTWAESGAISAFGALVGSSAWAWAETATLSALGALSGASAWVWGESGTLGGLGALEGTSAWTWTATGTASSSGSMAGTAAWVWTAAGTPSGTGALAGSATWTWTATIDNPSGAMTGTASWVWSVAGSMIGCTRYTGCNGDDYTYSTSSGTQNAACASAGYAGCNGDDYNYSSV